MKNRKEKGGLRSWHEEKGAFAVIYGRSSCPAQSDEFPEARIAGTCRDPGSSLPEMPARCQDVQATFDHIWKVRLLQVFVFLLSSRTDFLGSGLILRIVMETL